MREAAVRLNPKIPAKAIEDALESLLDRRKAMTLVAANQDIYHLLRDGFPVEFDNAKGMVVSLDKFTAVRMYVHPRRRVGVGSACADGW